MEIKNIEKDYLGGKNRKTTFFHYTSPEALINIVKGSSLRLTNCLFLNDTDEYVSILSLLKDTNKFSPEVAKFINSMRKDIPTDNIDYDFEYLNGRLRLTKGTFFVLSGSIDSDSLPLWNYYTKGDGYSGYSIAIDVNKLGQEFVNYKGRMLYGKVVYDEQEQTAIIERELQTLFGRYNMSKQEDADIENIQDSFFEFIQAIRLFFKEKSFSHEKEFRIVVFVPENEDRIKKDFFVRKGLICPCIYLKTDKLPIKEIKMSPTIEKEVGNKGLRSLLTINGYNEEVIISSSNIKVRF